MAAKHSIFFFVIILILHSKTSAQQADTIAAVNLQPVVVTATKFLKNQSETGKVLTVIDQEQIAQSQGKDLSQLLNEQVGLVINGSNSNPAKDKSVFLRGASGSYTLLMIDGIPITDPSGVGGAFDLRLLPLDHVERIEILKGSQSTLYGTDAIAGVINIITKQKGEQPLEAFGQFTYGSYNTKRANIGVAGTSKPFNYNVTYVWGKSDGISEAEDPSGNNNFEKDGYIENAFQLNTKLNLENKLSISPFLRYTTFDGSFDAGAFTDDLVASFDTEFLSSGLNGQYELQSGSVNLLYAYNKTQRRYTDSFGTYNYDGRYHHMEGFMNYEFTDNLQAVGGITYQDFKMMDESTTVKNPNTDMVNAYLSLYLTNRNRLWIELGGRVVAHSVYGTNFTYSLNPSYRLKQTKVFANYTTGFKAPTLTQLYGSFGANEDLQPEESKSAEIGVQYFSRSQKFDVRTTFFMRQIDNAISYTTQYVNLDKLDDRGFELEATLRLKKILLTSYYAFVQGEVTTPTPNGTETSENDLLRRPKHSLGFNFSYRVSDKLLTGITLKTFSKRNDVFFDLNTFTSEAVVLNSYQLASVYAQYTIWKGNLKFFVDARNLFNQTFYEVYGYSVQLFNVTGGIHMKLIKQKK